MQGARGGAVFTFRRPMHVAAEPRAPIGQGERRPRPGAGGMRSAGRAGPLAEPPGGERTRRRVQRIGMTVPAMPRQRRRGGGESESGRGSGWLCLRGGGGGSSHPGTPPPREPRRAGRRGVPAPAEDEGAAGPGMAPGRRGGAGASGALAEGGRRAGELSAALAHAQRGPGPRYIATWRRRQLSSAARAAATEVRGE